MFGLANLMADGILSIFPDKKNSFWVWKKLWSWGKFFSSMGWNTGNYKKKSWYWKDFPNYSWENEYKRYSNRAKEFSILK